MVRLGFIIGLIALIGVLLSGLATYRVYDQELTVDRIALARAIDVHASLVQERLTERELLARVASGLFRTPAVMKANMLQPLRSSIYAFKTDFVVASWIARLKPGELPAAQTELAGTGFPNSTIRNFDDTPLDIKSLNRPIDVLMDLEPRNAETMGLAGRSFDQDPALGPMFEQAVASGKPMASDPLPLLRPDGPIGIVLATPVLQESDSALAGFVTFSYELAPLMLTNDDLSLFSVVLRDPRSAGTELIANDQGDGHVTAGGRAGSGAVDNPGGDVRWPRLVAGLLRQVQFDQTRRADRGDRRRLRPRFDRDRLRAVRLCRLQ